MNVAFVVNPVAGGGRAEKAWRNLARKEPWINERAYFTDAPGDAERLAFTAVSEGADAVVAVGGDGTLNEVINGLSSLAQLPPVGIIPCGTGNDFARSANLPRDPQAALQVCVEGRLHQVDLGKVNERWFINVAGFGFDAAVAEEVASRAGHGPVGAIPYLAAVFKLLRRVRPVPVTLTVDGRTWTAPVFFGAIGNGSTYGGGMKICPDAAVDDGRFDLCMAHDFTVAESLFNLVKVFRGSHVKHRKCSYRRAVRIAVDGPPSVLVHADGQVIGRLPVSFELAPKAATFFWPSRDGSVQSGSAGSTSNSPNFSNSQVK